MTIDVGDRVRVTDAFGIARAGDVGTVRGFTDPGEKSGFNKTESRGRHSGSHPIVDVPKGRALVPERLLELEPDDAAAAARADRVPLGDEAPPSRAIEPVTPPPVDWVERPAPKIAIPAQVWTPEEEEPSGMALKQCIEDGCDKFVFARGLCSTHDSREREALKRARKAAEAETRTEAATSDEPKPTPVAASEPHAPHANPVPERTSHRGVEMPDPVSGHVAALAVAQPAASLAVAQPAASLAVAQPAASLAVASLGVAPLAGVAGEMATAVTAIRRAVASAALDGEGVGTITRLATALGHMEKLTGEMCGLEGASDG